jgi:phosphatidylglycerol:prolipoprotein diacylglycerol transferase
MYPYFDSIHWASPFGLLFISAILVSWWLARRNAVSVRIDGSHIDVLLPVAVIVGIAGAMLLSRVMPGDAMIAGEAMQADVRVRLFAMLGCGALAVFVYSRVTGLSFRRLLDVFALPTIAGLVIHRVGCFLAGCCWGDLVSNEPATRFATQVQTLPFLGGLTSGVQYPPGSLAYEQHLALGLIEPGALASLPVYPVQLFEGILLLGLLLVLRRFRWQQSPQGLLTVIVICAYAVMRFFLEYLRADGAVVLGNLTITQLQCLLLLSSATLLPGLLAQARLANSIRA